MVGADVIPDGQNGMLVSDGVFVALDVAEGRPLLVPLVASLACVFVGWSVIVTEGDDGLLPPADDAPFAGTLGDGEAVAGVSAAAVGVGGVQTATVSAMVSS